MLRPKLKETKSKYIRVLVIGIDEQNNAPESFNVAITPGKLNKTLSTAGMIVSVAIGATVGSVLGYMVTHKK
jgi:hypothetical protein